MRITLLCTASAFALALAMPADARQNTCRSLDLFGVIHLDCDKGDPATESQSRSVPREPPSDDDDDTDPDDDDDTGDDDDDNCPKGHDGYGGEQTSKKAGG